MATVRREGFETKIELEQFAMDVMVEALDANNDILGRSDVVTTIFPRKSQSADPEQELDSSQDTNDTLNAAKDEQNKWNPELSIHQDADGTSAPAKDKQNHWDTESENTSPPAEQEHSRPSKDHSHLVNAVLGVCVACVCVVLLIRRTFGWTQGPLQRLSRTRYNPVRQYEQEDE